MELLRLCSADHISLRASLSLFWQLKHLCCLDIKGSFVFSTEISSDTCLNTASLDLFEWSFHFHFSYSLQKYFTRRLNAENMKRLSVPFEVEHQTTLSRESASKSSDNTMHLWEVLRNQYKRLFPPHKTSLEYYASLCLCWSLLKNPEVWLHFICTALSCCSFKMLSVPLPKKII